MRKFLPLFFILFIGVISVYCSEVIPPAVEDTAEVDGLVNNSFLVRITAMLGFGGVCGFVTGFALKKIARIFAVILGVIFIVIQLFAFKGWISVDWNAIANSTDIFSGEGMSAFMKKLIHVLRYNLPFGSSFILGLFMGIKKR